MFKHSVSIRECRTVPRDHVPAITFLCPSLFDTGGGFGVAVGVFVHES
ncbi:hypothetical protein NJ7G_1287 [Natrinema sp. J7-2]|nr:hypothetical protein NJ7G_1287 [Natrinema sp. J7-2]